MASGYSILRLLTEAARGNRHWQPAWRDASPRADYDVIVVGGGGHGLATAFYLAKAHGIRRVAVLEKGWIGGGNVGRNTTIVRSNYLLPGNIPFYEWSMKLWEGLEQELNYNAMVSQRGVLNLFHTDAQRDAAVRRGNAMRLHGVDAELLDAREVRAFEPLIDTGGPPAVIVRPIVSNGKVALLLAVTFGKSSTTADWFASSNAAGWSLSRLSSVRAA